MTYIPRKHFEQALAFVSDEETRYYLKGVHVVSTPSHWYVEATDGFIAYAAGAAIENGEGETFNVIIPKDIVKAALKADKKPQALKVHVDGQRVTLGYAGIGSNVIDGTFPDMRRVLPVHTSGDVRISPKLETSEQIGFNPSYLAKIAKVLRKNAVELHANDRGPAVVAGTEAGTFIVIMPMRGGNLLTAPVDSSKALAAIYGDA